MILLHLFFTYIYFFLYINITRDFHNIITLIFYVHLSFYIFLLQEIFMILLRVFLQFRILRDRNNCRAAVFIKELFTSVRNIISYIFFFLYHSIQLAENWFYLIWLTVRFNVWRSKLTHFFPLEISIHLKLRFFDNWPT